MRDSSKKVAYTHGLSNRCSSIRFLLSSSLFSLLSLCFWEDEAKVGVFGDEDRRGVFPYFSK